MENDQSDYIKELQCKIITLEQEVDRLKKLNNNQAKYIHANLKFQISNLKSYGQQKYDPYTKKEKILVKSTPQSRQYYVSDNTHSF